MIIKKATFEFRTPSDIELVIDKVFLAFPYLTSGVLAIFELMTNSVEHGNLEISFEKKTALLEADTVAEEIEKRLVDPKYKDRISTIEIIEYDSELDNETHVHISDNGPGFNWEKYLNIDLGDVEDMHGRGIPISREFSKELRYMGRGNEVIAVFNRPPAE